MLLPKSSHQGFGTPRYTFPHRQHTLHMHLRLCPCLHTNNSVTCMRTPPLTWQRWVLSLEWKSYAGTQLQGHAGSAMHSHMPVIRLAMSSQTYTDCWPQSQNGHNHLITFINNHAHDASIYGQHDKSQVGQAFKAFISRAQQSTRQTVEACYSDSSSKHDAGHLQRAPCCIASLHNTLPTHTIDFFTPKDALSSNKPDVF